MIDRTELRLSIEAWSKADRMNFGRIIHLDIDAIQDTSGPAWTSLREIVPATEVSDVAFRTLGQRAALKGVADTTREWHLEMEPTAAIPILPAYDIRHWNKLEGTFPDDRIMSPAKVARFPSWNNNSCPVDVVISAAQAFGLGVNQRDAISFSAWRGLRPVQATFRMLLEALRKNMSAETLELLKGLLGKALAEDARIKYTPGDTHDTNKIAMVCLEGLPSCSYDAAGALVCCDQELRFRPGGGNVPARRYYHPIQLADSEGRIRLLGKRLEAIIADKFFGSQLRSDHGVHSNPNRMGTGELRSPMEPCSKGARCVQLYDRHTVVFAAMPAILMINVEGGAECRQPGRDFFRDITIQVRMWRPDTQDIVLARSIYRVRAMTVCTGWEGRGTAHFTLSVRDLCGTPDGTISRIDGLRYRGAPIISKHGWGAKDADKIMTLFYEVQSQTVRPLGDITTD